MGISYQRRIAFVYYILHYSVRLDVNDRTHMEKVRAGTCLLHAGNY